MRDTLRLVALVVFLEICTVGGAIADASGPDFLRVTGVAADDMLNIRDAPNATSAKIGKIPVISPGALFRRSSTQNRYDKPVEARIVAFAIRFHSEFRRCRGLVGRYRCAAPFTSPLERVRKVACALAAGLSACPVPLLAYQMT